MLFCQQDHHTIHGLDLGKRFILGCDVLIPEIDGIQMMRKIKAVEPTLIHSTNTLNINKVFNH